MEGPDGVVQFVKNLSAPVLAANLILEKVPELATVHNLYRSIVLNKGHIKIGIVGYLTPETKFLAPKNDVEYEDEIVAIRREVSKLKEQGINILIALGHSGFLKDKEIAEKVEDLDLVIGGHTNTFLWNSNTTDEIPEVIQGPYPDIVIQPSGRKVLVVQAYAYTKYMGKLHVIFNSKGEILHYDGTPILLNQKVPRDPELLELVQKYRDNINIISNEVVGKSMVFLNGEECRIRECNLGNLINDAMLFYTIIYGNPSPHIAITQGGRIRGSILRSNKPPFDVTRGDLIAVLPFSDTLTILTMNGTTLLQALEHSVEDWQPLNAPGQFIQFSGMRVKFDLAQPRGSRVVEAKAICSNCGYSNMIDIQEEYEYKVLTSTFLADSGDGYKMFEELPKETLPFNEVTSIIGYLKTYSPVNPTIDGRIILLNENNVNHSRVGRVLEPNTGTVVKLIPCLNVALVVYNFVSIFYTFLILKM